jgi:hypothetical protein
MPDPRPEHLTGGEHDLPQTESARRCGRCLQMFPAEHGLDPNDTREWWTCPVCRAALLPSRRDR